MSRRPPKARTGAGREHERKHPGKHARKHAPAKKVVRGDAQARDKRAKSDTRDTRDPRDKKDPRANPRQRPRAAVHGRNPHLHRHAQAPAPDRELPRDALERLQQAERLMRGGEALRVGEWLWTTREGAERDLVEDLLLSGPVQPRGLGASLVASKRAPGDPTARIDVTFARQGFPVSAVVQAYDVHELAQRVATGMITELGTAQNYALHVFVPDSTEANPLAQRAQALETALVAQLQAARPNATRSDDFELRRASLPLLQVCLYTHDTLAWGVVPSDRALSLAAGGRARMKLDSAAPSRAARKLEEAFSWLGVSPGPGELCVDLGAAPGGWSWLLLERRARVIAVDPARMDPKLAGHGRLRHVQGSAFDFAPDETVDWLFCDMAWRPLEVAQMLARWSRRHFTRLLVANFKLPMKRKAEMVARLRAILEDGGFTSIRTRQLYHDRDEITLTARVR